MSNVRILKKLRRLLTLLQTEQTQIRQLPDQGLLSLIKYDPTLVDLTSNFFVICTNVKDYLHNYS